MKKLNLYYDGLCRLCSREMDVYKEKDNGNKLNFVDITEDNFDAKAEGLDLEKVNKIFHVKTEDGQIISGVDAFIEIWKRLPQYKKWAEIANKRYIKVFLKLSYHVFANIRPYLPKKERCDSAYCRL